MNTNTISETIKEAINPFSYLITKIYHKKSGKVTFITHRVNKNELAKWLDNHSNYREVSKEVFEKIREAQLLPDVLFENLSASFPDRKFDASTFPSAICEQLNARFNVK